MMTRIMMRMIVERAINIKRIFIEYIKHQRNCELFYYFKNDRK